ncbi:unnamed protein product, partial [marine sediment metagenome]
MGKVILSQRGGMGDWWMHEKATIRKAKKDWSCKECGRPIIKGEEYVDDVFTGRSNYL